VREGRYKKFVILRGKRFEELITEKNGRPKYWKRVA
jgi:hypothetical protein